MISDTCLFSPNGLDTYANCSQYVLYQLIKIPSILFSAILSNKLVNFQLKCVNLFKKCFATIFINILTCTFL